MSIIESQLLSGLTTKFSTKVIISFLDRVAVGLDRRRKRRRNGWSFAVRKTECIKQFIKQNTSQRHPFYYRPEHTTHRDTHRISGLDDRDTHVTVNVSAQTKQTEEYSLSFLLALQRNYRSLGILEERCFESSSAGAAIRNRR